MPKGWGLRVEVTAGIADEIPMGFAVELAAGIPIGLAVVLAVIAVKIAIVSRVGPSVAYRGPCHGMPWGLPVRSVGLVNCRGACHGVPWIFSWYAVGLAIVVVSWLPAANAVCQDNMTSVIGCHGMSWK